MYEKMNKIKKKFLKGLALTGGTLLAMASFAQDSSWQTSVKLANAEVAVKNSFDDEVNMNYRFIVMGTATHDSLQVTYTGRHNTVDFNDNTYLGRNSIAIGGKNWPVQPSVVAMTNNEGVKDVKVGLRSTAVPKTLGAKMGFFEVGANDKAVTSTYLASYPLGEHMDLNVVNITHLPYASKPVNITELQLCRDFGEKTQAFVRASAKIGHDEEAGKAYINPSLDLGLTMKLR